MEELPEQQIHSQLAGRLRLFQDQWKLLTNDQDIKDIVSGGEIPLIETLSSVDCSSFIPREGNELVQQEIQSLLEKGAIEIAQPSQDQELSSLFLREKKDSSQRPILNLKNSNQYIPYINFKMESLKEVKNLIKKGDLMVKIDLKDA